METKQIKQIDWRRSPGNYLIKLAEVFVLPICLGVILATLSSVTLGQVPNPSPEKSKDSVEATPSPINLFYLLSFHFSFFGQ